MKLLYDCGTIISRWRRKIEPFLCDLNGICSAGLVINNSVSQAIFYLIQLQLEARLAQSAHKVVKLLWERHHQFQVFPRSNLMPLSKVYSTQVYHMRHPVNHRFTLTYKKSINCQYYYRPTDSHVAVDVLSRDHTCLFCAARWSVTLGIMSSNTHSVWPGLNE